MKKTKLIRNNRSPRKRYFEQKHIDIHRHGDMLVFEDISGYTLKEPGENVENLRYICFQDSYGNRAMIDIAEGRTRKYQAYTTIPEEEQTGIRIPDAEEEDATVMRPTVIIPYLPMNAVLTKETLAYFCEDISLQVMQQDFNYSEALLNRIELLEIKIRELEEREERQNWEAQTGIST